MRGGRARVNSGFLVALAGRIMSFLVKAFLNVQGIKILRYYWFRVDCSGMFAASRVLEFGDEVRCLWL